MSHHHHRHRSRSRGDTPPRRHPEAIALLVVAIGLIAMLTLGNGDMQQPTSICVICTGQMADGIMNLLLFVPLGVALSTLGVGARRAIAIGAAGSVAIELIQLFVLDGRYASPADVVANALGTAAGVALAGRREAILYPRSDGALRLAIAGAAAWVFMSLLTAVGLGHAFPGDAYHGQWAPELRGQPHFGGRVANMTINSIPIGDGPVDDSASLRGATRAGVDVVVLTTPGQPTRTAAPIARLIDSRDRELVYLARRESDLTARTRVLASAIGLHSPTVVVPDAFVETDRAASVPVPITVERRRDLFRASVGGETAVLPIHPALGWMLLLPFDAELIAQEILVSTLWTSLPLIVVGYWLGRRARRRARRSGRERGWSSTAGELTMTVPPLLMLLFIGLGGVPMLFGQRVPAAEVWVGAAAGIGLGMAFGVRFALRRAHGHRRAGGQESVPLQEAAAPAG